MSEKDGGPAFPNIGMSHLGSGPATMVVFSQGMTLRQWYAGMALQGMCANPDISRTASIAKMSPQDVRDSFSESAFKQADAMIKAESEGAGK